MAEHKDKGCLALEGGGFVVHQTHRANRWYDVTAPDGVRGAVLRQYPNAWHFFWRDAAATASGGAAATCHRGGLGDALDDDEAIARYCHLLEEQNVPADLRQYSGVYAAMQQAVSDPGRRW